MKKLLIALFTFGYMFAFSQTATLTIPGDLNVANAGDQVVVPITIDNISQPDIGSFLISILFDGTALTFNSYQNLHPNANPSFYSDNVVNGNDYRGNWLDFIALSSFDVAVGDVLIELVFTVNANSDFTFATSKKVENNFAIKQATEMITGSFLPYALTLNNGAVTLGGAGSQWLGLTDEWFDGNNWSTGSFPGNTDNVIIPAGTPNEPVIRDYANVKGVMNDGIITIDPGALGLNAAALIMNNGGQLENNGSIVLMSVYDPGFPPILPSGTFLGQVVPDPIGGLSGTGTYEVQRFMNMTLSGTPEYIGWHYLSSPVDGFDTEGIYNYYLNTWDETTGMWNHVEGDPVNPCTPVTPPLPMEEMQGWSLKEDMDWPSYNCPGGTENTIEMIGTPWTAPYETPVTNTAIGTNQGYNLVGNPFFCGLDLLAVDWTVNNVNVDPTAYVYQEAIQNYITVSGTTPDPFVGNTIPSTLGFFVNANAAGNLSFDGNEQTIAFGAINKTSVDNSLFIKASSSTSFDIMRIYFNEEATVGYDRMWDAYKLFSLAGDVPQIYTPGGEDILATNALQVTDMVSMSFKASTDGTYTIEAIETSTFSEVYLEDLVTGEVTDLLIDSYTFSYTAGEEEGRFIIHFSPVGIGENLMNGVSIWSSDNSIYVTIPEELKGTIAVYNMMGQEVVSADTQPGITNVIPMKNANTYYVVKVLSNDNAVTGKVYIK